MFLPWLGRGAGGLVAAVLRGLGVNDRLNGAMWSDGRLMRRGGYDACVHAEKGNAGLELFGMGRQLLRGRGHLLRRTRILLRHFVELLDRLVDLVRPDILLATRGADLGDQIRGLLDVRHQPAQHLPGLLRGLHRAGRQLADLAGRRLAAFGQLSNLRGDHGETPAMFAGPRCFDRGIERQQIGLPRDLLDDRDFLGDGLHGSTALFTASPDACASFEDWPAIFSVWLAFSAFCLMLADISSIDAEASSVEEACSLAPCAMDCAVALDCSLPAATWSAAPCTSRAKRVRLSTSVLILCINRL